MNPTLNAVVGGLVGNSMVSYIIQFFMAVGVLYIAAKGAMFTWDAVKTTWLSLRTDVKEAKRREISLFRLWKERIDSVKSPVERLA